MKALRYSQNAIRAFRKFMMDMLAVRTGQGNPQSSGVETLLDFALASNQLISCNIHKTARFA